MLTTTAAARHVKIRLTQQIKVIIYNEKKSHYWQHKLPFVIINRWYVYVCVCVFILSLSLSSVGHFNSWTIQNGNQFFFNDFFRWKLKCQKKEKMKRNEKKKNEVSQFACKQVKRRINRFAHNLCKSFLRLRLRFFFFLLSSRKLLDFLLWCQIFSFAIV